MDAALLSPDAILIGTGGGFSGAYDGFAITKEGDVFSWRSMSDTPDTLQHLFRTPEDSARYFFHFLDSLGFDVMKSTASGNMNSFIEHRGPNSKHRVHWSQDAADNSQELPSFYSSLRTFIKRNTPAK